MALIEPEDAKLGYPGVLVGKDISACCAADRVAMLANEVRLRHVWVGRPGRRIDGHLHGPSGLGARLFSGPNRVG